MSKPRVDWGSGELLTSVKLDEMVLDDIRAGRLAFKYVGNDLGAGAGNADPIYFHQHPYNPAKSVYDRLRVYATRTSNITTVLEYSFDNAVWVPLPVVGTDSGVDTSVDDTSLGRVTANLLFWDIDVSSIAATTFIGLRWTAAGAFRIHYNIMGIFYRASDDAF